MTKEKTNNDNLAVAKLKSLRTGTRKLNLVADLIRGKHVNDALVELKFCKRRIAKDVYNCLFSAISNAENNADLDPDSLYVSEVNVGKAMVMKRFRARARGRGARIEKPFSNLSIIVEQREE